MSDKKLFGKIVWAVDAFAERDTQENTLATLRAITQGARAVINPVYVLTPGQMNLTAKFYPAWEQLYRPSAEKLLLTLEREANLPGMAAPRVLAREKASTRQAVELVTRFAEEHDADLIALSTHARKGMDRFLLGSFAETMLLHSRLPTLIANPRAARSERFERILFATDLSDASWAAFQSLVPLASRLDAAVTLFYKVLTPQELGFPTSPGFEGIAAEDVDEARQRAEKWTSWAKQRGVASELVIDKGQFGVAASIVKAAEGGHQLIAMVAQTGPVASLLVGSITRQVVRTATRPVIVFRQND